MPPRKPSRDFLLASLVFTVTMSVYLFTLAPTVTIEDSGEFITAVYVLGIPHPPGFPLYILLGKLFTIVVPIGTVAWRVNLLSAVFGALTAALLSAIISRLSRNRVVALSGGLLLAFSPIFWSQSIIAEVYTLNTFFVAFLLFLLIEWSVRRRESYLLWFSFLYGLSLTNHTMMVLIAPAFGFYILLIDRTVWRNFKLLIKLLGLFVLGLAPYLYLPLRALQHPLLNSGDPSSLGRFLAHVTRRTYNDFRPDQALFSKVGLVLHFFLLIYEQFFLPTLFLAAGGLAYLFKKRPDVGVLTVGIFLLNSVGIIFLRGLGWSSGIGYTYRVYYLPSFLVVVVWLGMILSYLYDWLRAFCGQRAGQLWRVSQTAFFIFVLSLPMSFLVANYQSNDLSDFWLSYDYSRGVLESLEPNSVLLFSYDGSLNGDTEIFDYLYLKLVEGIRPDVTIVNELDFFKNDANLTVSGEFEKLSFEQRRFDLFNLLDTATDRPLYNNFAVPTTTSSLQQYSLSNGMAHRVYPGLDAAAQAWEPVYLPSIRNLDNERLTEQYSIAGLVAHYYYNQAALYLTRGQFNRSQDYLIKAFNLDNAPFNHEYWRHLQYRAQWFSIKPPPP
ncbi:MAG: hypothetical protein A3J59_00940 [Candidatus Buchananbacteria bacterium RIFCSPHIGHO2_02_FULL_56_16]|uniref:DUF2723 domain-containing protein n=1 Tax=Candidatus Buchananbacteria bacterium RIFCSPHIGHO2_02_FULL_56_16 TaxID=1797542 RepID=A0A1G1YE34_9BACT|nr:MAG: hypothetical protein A3J59_00940 [Candidatus Buchananbacteria bacterium RIFCSPHIGHO2_02_FULL_56_16]